MARAMDAGLNSMPVGDEVILNFNERNLFAIFSAKHDPIEKIELWWSIFSVKGFICVFVIFTIIFNNRVL